MKKSLILFSFIFMIVLSAYAVYQYNEYLNDHVMLNEYTYTSEKLPKAFDGYKIFVIADLHNAPFSEQIIEKIKLTDPDMIVFVGDMVQLPDNDISEAIKIAGEFNGEIPTFAISGNHDKQCRDYWEIYDKLYYSAGVTWLEGYTQKIEKNGEAIYIAGLDDQPYEGFDNAQYGEIRNKINAEQAECPGFTIFLNHRAGIYPMIKDLGLDLIISGHLHGGIVRLPFVGGIVRNGGSLGLFPYNEGFIQEELFSPMIVSRGCDRNPEKKRWFNQPEVLLITLESE